jgi:hypothetical protein
MRASENNMKAWFQLLEQGDMVKIQNKYNIHVNVVRAIFRSGKSRKGYHIQINEFFKEKAQTQLKELDKIRRKQKKLIDDLD